MDYVYIPWGSQGRGSGVLLVILMSCCQLLSEDERYTQIAPHKKGNLTMNNTVNGPAHIVGARLLPTYEEGELNISA